MTFVLVRRLDPVRFADRAWKPRLVPARLSLHRPLAVSPPKLIGGCVRSHHHPPWSNLWSAAFSRAGITHAPAAAPAPLWRGRRAFRVRSAVGCAGGWP